MSAKTIASIRYCAATHVSGAQKCPDGKQWGSTDPPGAGNWQSGMWTGTYAWTAWLAWDRLDLATKKDVERVVGWECDMLAKGHPPIGLWWDTKAEENGWEVPCLVLGELMFPNNSHQPAWHVSAEEYMMNTLCTAADATNNSIVDGRPVNQWVRGANLQPDYTLENHGFFHPSYVGCSSYFMTQAALYCTYAGQPVPAAATHHFLDTWGMFQTILLPWGEPACPQGMDWELHGLPFINLYAALATRQKDRLAARLEQQSLQYLRAWQNMHHGELDIPGSRYGFGRHAVNAEQLSYAFLAHKIFGPAAAELSARAAARRETGAWDRPYVDFIAQRTVEKFASFSWKNKIMGLIMPIDYRHASNPEFIAPVPEGLIGSFDLAPRGSVKTSVVEHERHLTADGFVTSGTLLRNGGRLRQTLRITSLGPRAVVYEDRVTAVSNITLRAEKGLEVGIENDEITGGLRLLTDARGQTRFAWNHTQPAKAVAGNWANVDGRLSVIVVRGSPIEYVQAKGYTSGIAVGEDMLYGSYTEGARHYKAGDEVARRLAIFLVETSPRKTAAIARSCRIEHHSSGSALSFSTSWCRRATVPIDVEPFNLTSQ
jgi:hypothetical protein